MRHLSAKIEMYFWPSDYLNSDSFQALYGISFTHCVHIEQLAYPFRCDSFAPVDLTCIPLAKRLCSKKKHSEHTRRHAATKNRTRVLRNNSHRDNGSVKDATHNSGRSRTHALHLAVHRNRPTKLVRELVQNRYRIKFTDFPPTNNHSQQQQHWAKPYTFAHNHTIFGRGADERTDGGL